MIVISICFTSGTRSRFSPSTSSQSLHLWLHLFLHLSCRLPSLIHHFHYLSFTPGFKATSSANLSALNFLSPSGQTPRTITRTVGPIFRAILVFDFLFFSYFLNPCGRLNGLAVSFWCTLIYLIVTVSYRTAVAIVFSDQGGCYRNVGCEHSING